MNSFRKLLFATLLASLLGLASAGPVAAGPVDSEAAAIEAALDAKTFGNPTADANASRRKRPRFMPMYKAKNNARFAAYQIYLDPEFNFDRYGIGKCRRFSRSTVYCYTWASEDIYDDLGYYSDTILCDWFTVSKYDWRGKMKIKIDLPDCVLMSEI